MKKKKTKCQKESIKLLSEKFFIQKKFWKRCSCDIYAIRFTSIHNVCNMSISICIKHNLEDIR